VEFGDVLLADIFTSFSRVFADLTAASCAVVFVSPEKTEFLSSHHQVCSHTLLAALVMILPYYFRLRQCIADYNYGHRKNPGQYWNAVKYGTVFPAQILSYIIATRQGVEYYSIVNTLW
jgi:hypothetical protein